MATATLFDLLGQALGPQPSGVVNFNQLHRLLLEIISHLGHLHETTREQTTTFVQTDASNQSIATAASPHERVRSAREVVSPAESAGAATSLHSAETVSQPAGALDALNENDNISKNLHEQDTSTGVDTTIVETREDAKVEEAWSRSAIPASESLRLARVESQWQPLGGRVETARSLAAINDVGVLENRLGRIETRLEAMETLPEAMKRAAEGGKPVSDMWHYTSLEKRMDAAEQSIDRSSGLFDEMMSRIRGLEGLGERLAGASGRVDDVERSNGRLRDQVAESERKRLEEMNEVNKRLAALEKRPAADGGPSSAFVEELERKLEQLTIDVSALSGNVVSLSEGLTNSASKEAVKDMVTWTELERALKSTKDEIRPPSPPRQHPSEEIQKMLGDIGDLRGKHEILDKQLADILAALAEKVSASDLSQLMSQGDDGTASENVMAMLLELQTKANALEAKLSELSSRVGAVPATVTDDLNEMRRKMDEMQNAVNDYQEMKNSLLTLQDNMDQLNSSSLTTQHIDNLSEQLKQLRDQVTQLDQAVSSLSQAIIDQPVAVPETISKETLEAIHRHLHEMQDEQERLADFARKLAEEIAVKEDHIKTLYGSIGDMDSRKADKSFVEHEVDEKADRRMLENKASRAFVHDTFTKLDQEIRDARQRLSGQEEALNKAVNQLSSDVDSKLDRLEIEPLKQYFEDRFSSIHIPEPSEPKADELEPAGMRKGLQYNCISCARPVIVHPTFRTIPTLPQSKTLPGSKSLRAYTTYELDLVRQHQRRYLSQALTLPPTNRSCGGSHTTIFPQQKLKMTQLTNVYTDVDVPMSVLSDGTETELRGLDGHVYKGRIFRPAKLPALRLDHQRNGHIHAPSEPPHTRSSSPRHPSRSRTRSANQMHS